MSTTATKSTTTTTLSASEAAYSELTKGTYTVSGSGLSDGGVQARLLCSPAGSNKYYQDTRLSNGVLHIDMTKEVPYT